MKTKTQKLKRNKDGSILVFVVFVFLIVSIMAATISVLFSNNLTQAKRQEDNLRAHYLAMSGIDMTVATLMSTVEVSGGEEVKMHEKIKKNNVNIDGWEDDFLLDGETIKIKLSYDKVDEEFTIISSVDIGDNLHKELSLSLEFSGLGYKKIWN